MAQLSLSIVYSSLITLPITRGSKPTVSDYKGRTVAHMSPANTERRNSGLNFAAVGGARSILSSAQLGPLEFTVHPILFDQACCLG